MKEPTPTTNGCLSELEDHPVPLRGVTASDCEHQAESQSARKRKADAEYTKNRRTRLESHWGLCEFQRTVVPEALLELCTQESTETHHVMRRSHTGEPNHDVGNLRALCKTHHDFIHANVAWSKANGFIVSAWPQLVSSEESN